MSKLVDELLNKLKENRISIEEISKEIVIPANRISQWKKGRGAPKAEDSEKIQKWLTELSDQYEKKKGLSDEGSMHFAFTKHNMPEPKPYLQQRFEAKLRQPLLLIPFYDAEASAGLSDMDMSAKTSPTSQIDVGDLLRDSQAAMRIYGNSMTPNYPSGCVLGIVENVDGFIQPGEVYVIETANSRYFKRLYYNDANTAYICLSDNTSKFEAGPMEGKYFYQPFEVPFEKVRRLFDVTGVIKRNKNSSIIQK